MPGDEILLRNQQMPGKAQKATNKPIIIQQQHNMEPQTSWGHQLWHLRPHFIMISTLFANPPHHSFSFNVIKKKQFLDLQRNTTCILTEHMIITSHRLICRHFGVISGQKYTTQMQSIIRMPFAVSMTVRVKCAGSNQSECFWIRAMLKFTGASAAHSWCVWDALACCSVPRTVEWGSALGSWRVQAIGGTWRSLQPAVQLSACACVMQEVIHVMHVWGCCFFVFFSVSIIRTVRLWTASSWSGFAIG